jgi:chitinase
MGASELVSFPGDVRSPSTPASLAVTSADATSISLGWMPSSDDTGVAGYDVFLDGAKVATVSSAGATVAGLSCGRSYSLGVQAFDAAGNRSAEVSTSGSTTACPASGSVVDTTPPTVSMSVKSTRKALTVSASAVDDSGIRELRFLLNGRTVCVVSASTGSCRMTVSGSGPSMITVQATDNAGNVGQASTSIGGSRVSARQLAVDVSMGTARPAFRRHVGPRR